MNAAEFEAALARDGYTDVDTRELPASHRTDEHSHPFDVRAFVVTGSITLHVQGRASTYRKGDVFDLAAGCAHAESVGAEGVSYLVGRRHRPS